MKIRTGSFSKPKFLKNFWKTENQLMEGAQS